MHIARHAAGLLGSQVETARALGIPQPTLSKIVHGRVTNLSLELLIRIATRAQLQLVLVTGKVPAEAGVFASVRAVPDRVQRSLLADRSRQDVSSRADRLSPEQRLDAQLQLSELLINLQRGAELSQSGRVGSRPVRKRDTKKRKR